MRTSEQSEYDLASRDVLNPLKVIERIAHHNVLWRSVEDDFPS